jgi:hypothetical protein
MRESMEIYPRTAAERAMKLQEVLLRATAGKIKWWQAAELIGRVAHISIRPKRMGAAGLAFETWECTAVIPPPLGPMGFNLHGPFSSFAIVPKA